MPELIPDWRRIFQVSMTTCSLYILRELYLASGFWLVSVHSDFRRLPFVRWDLRIQRAFILPCGLARLPVLSSLLVCIWQVHGPVHWLTQRIFQPLITLSHISYRKSCLPDWPEPSLLLRWLPLCLPLIPC